MPGLNPTQEDIETFVAITQATHEEALHFLSTGTHLQGAIEDFYAAQTATGAVHQTDPDSDQDELEAEDIMSDPQQPEQPAQVPSGRSGGTTLGGQPAEALPAGWGRPAASRVGRIGQSNEDDDDDDDPKKQGQEFYTGGEKSGLAVQDPNKPGQGAHRGIVDNILKQAAANTPKPEAPGSSRNAFTGSGNVLGTEDPPTPTDQQSAPTPAQQPASGSNSLLNSLFGGAFGGSAPPPPEEEAEEEEESQTRQLTFWSNGFSIEDGPLYKYDDPANQKLLEDIQNGRAPPSLFGVRYNQPVQIEVAQRTREEYSPQPKAPMKAFGGGGNRLGSPAPQVTPSTGSMPGGILQGGQGQKQAASTGQSAANVGSQTKFEVDSSKPTTSIQVRLGDGTKLVARVNLTHTVGDLRNFVLAARPDNRPFVLQTTFPSRELSDGSETVESAKLQNAVVVQRFT